MTVKKDRSDSLHSLRRRMIHIGRAMNIPGLQGSHSGNLSLKAGDEMLITRSGAMKGDLSDGDIVLPGLYQKNPDCLNASIETGTHRAVLMNRGALVHAHSTAAVMLAADLDRVVPMDYPGKYFLDTVPVCRFRISAGSKEMEKRIPRVLEEHTALIVANHGTFVCGRSIEEAFRDTSVLDHSCRILYRLREYFGADSPVAPPRYSATMALHAPAGREAPAGVKHDIDHLGAHIYAQNLSPFLTGMVSLHDGKQTRVFGGISKPEYIGEAVIQSPSMPPPDDFLSRLHSHLPHNRRLPLLLFLHSPWSVTESLVCFHEGRDMIQACDDENRMLHPEIPVCHPSSPLKYLAERLSRFPAVLLAGVGLISRGADLRQALRHHSALETMCEVRFGVRQLQRCRDHLHNQGG